MRIGIVNDLSLVCHVLRSLVNAAPGHEVAWVAHDGVQAVSLCKKDRPDLILMDLIMPNMNGVEATRRIMQSTPCPILVVTFDVGRNASMVFEAMGHGALDAVDTPKGLSKKGGADRLLEKIRLIGNLVEGSGVDGLLSKKKQLARPSLIVVGASTGGPFALREILRNLPLSFPAAVIVVQHVDPDFAPGLARWLGKQTKHRVEIVRDGTWVTQNSVYLASTLDHLVVDPMGRLAYTADPMDTPYRPSVDVFFHSLARNWPLVGERRGMAVLLTGMGRDGALGMQALHRKRWRTIAQNGNSCVVNGMPKAAIDLGVVDEVHDPKGIAKAMIRYFGQNHG